MSETDLIDEKPENPYVFPHDTQLGKQFVDHEGMSLRDYFAAHCPISHADAFHLISAQTEVGTVDCTKIMEAFCRMRFEYADAMLKARGI